MKYEFILQGLNCANCAAKIEKKIAETDGFKNISFSFATKNLSLESNKNNVKSKIISIVDSIEDGVTVLDKNAPAESDNSDKSKFKNRFKYSILAVSVVSFVIAFVLDILDISEISTAILSFISVALAGYSVFIKGVKSVVKFRLDETTLLTIAVIAAFALNEFAEAAAVTVLFVIGEMLEDKAVDKSRRDIKKLADIRPDTATVVKSDGTFSEIPAETVKIGSTIIIKPYSRIPIDGIVIDGASYIDASALTGESKPINAGVGTKVLSGMLNGESLIKIKTTHAYSDSAATRIIDLVENSTKNKSESEKLITRFASIYTPVVIVISILIAVVPTIFGGNFSIWLYRALVCLVASCPCSIVISVPLAYFAGIGAASKSGVLIKGGKYVEAIANTKCIAFDKTGTLTTGKMSISTVKAYKGYSENQIIQLAASCEIHSTHPIAKAIKKEAQNRNLQPILLENYNEKAGFGVTATYNSEQLSCCSNENGYGIILKINDDIIGNIIVSDTVREESAYVIKKLKKLKIDNIVMLTGDKSEQARQVASSLDVDKFYSSLLPQDKVEKVSDLINKYKVCCFVGDGINDAPVLATSSCGIAMGLASESAIESADAVLSSGDLKNLPKAIMLCRKVMSTVKFNITFSLLIKIAIIALAALGIAPVWLAVFADTGICLLCVLNSTRLIKDN